MRRLVLSVSALILSASVMAATTNATTTDQEIGNAVKNAMQKKQTQNTVVKTSLIYGGSDISRLVASSAKTEGNAQGTYIV